jgi:2-amino-4-hydroxy-6-hydroxymethyldihydropteridine diphosphokinase
LNAKLGSILFVDGLVRRQRFSRTRAILLDWNTFHPVYWRVYLSLGSNLGDSIGSLRAAIRLLRGLERIKVRTVSSVYETEPVGKVDQPAFLNVAIEIETDFEPLELLELVKETERQLGRSSGERWVPRPIDIDIVLWGDRIHESERLTIPHRAFRERAFVLAPLNEIAPDAVDPVTGLTVRALAARPEAAGRVRFVEPAGTVA